MNAATLQLQSTGFYLAGIAGRSQARPTLFHKIQLFIEAPSALKAITDAMSGEALATLTHEDAASLYQALSPAYLRLKQTVHEVSLRSSALESFLLRGWLRNVDEGLEDMEDILEALAWGGDVELRDHIDTAIAGIHER